MLANLKSFPNLKKFFKDEQLELLLKKGVYPYEYVTNVGVFDETKLPPKEVFESLLNDTKITDMVLYSSRSLMGCSTKEDRY